jgi:hypothetical protein
MKCNNLNMPDFIVLPEPAPIPVERLTLAHRKNQQQELVEKSRKLLYNKILKIFFIYKNTSKILFPPRGILFLTVYPVQKYQRVKGRL